MRSLKKTSQKAGVRRLPSGTWEASIELGRDKTGKRRRKSVYAASRNEAVHRRAQELTRAQPSIDAREMTAQHLLQEWLEHVRRNNRWATYQQRETMVRRHLTPRLVSSTRLPLRLRDLAPSDLRRLLGQMEADRIGEATIHSAFVALRAALQFAIVNDYVVENVCMRVPIPKVIAKERAVLSPEQLHKLFQCAQSDRFYALILLAGAVGARQGELFALTWRCVDFERSAINISATLTENEHGTLQATPTKTKKSERWFNISKGARDALASLYERNGRPEPDQWVFSDSRGNPVRRSNFIRRCWRPLLRRAELPLIRFHDLRGSFATNMHRAGIPIDDISEMLGHADRRTTERFYNQNRFVVGSPTIADAFEKLMADQRADHDAKDGPSDAHRKARDSLFDAGLERGGDGGTRTPDPLHAKQVLYQLSYIPTGRRIGYSIRSVGARADSPSTETARS